MSKVGASWDRERIDPRCAITTAISVDGAGNAHLVWTEGDSASYIRESAGHWTAATTIPLGPFDGWVDADIAAPPTGRPVVVLGSVHDDAGLHVPQTWSMATGQYESEDVAYGATPTVALEPDGTPLIGAYLVVLRHRLPVAAARARLMDRTAVVGDRSRHGGSSGSRRDRVRREHRRRVRRARRADGLSRHGRGLPDALSASGAAARVDGFLALTRTGSLPEVQVASSSARLRPGDSARRRDRSHLDGCRAGRHPVRVYRPAAEGRRRPVRDCCSRRVR